MLTDPSLLRPGAVTDLATVVERVDGVHYRALIRMLSGGNDDLADTALSHLLSGSDVIPPATG